VSADPWDRLGIDRTTDEATIKRAYARQLKAIHPETDPAGFVALREARDRALALAVMQVEASLAADARGWADEPPDPIDAPEEEEEEAVALVADALPAAVEDALRALHAMVFELGRRARPDAIAAQTEEVVALVPGLSIDHGRAVEQFLAETIVQGTPRSDPMIDPAVRQFAWDAAAEGFERSPLIEWIMQRRDDRVFEIALETNNPGFASLLARLRRPLPPRGLGWTAWWEAPRVDYLLAYCDSRHPTTLAGLNRDTLAWWAAFVEAQRRRSFPLGWIHRRRLRAIWGSRIEDGTVRSFSLFRVLFFLAMPYVGIWFVIRGRQAWDVRALAIAYCLLFFALPMLSKAPPAPSPTAANVPQAYFQSRDADLNLLLRLGTAGQVSTIDLAARNPALLTEMAKDWHAARLRQDWIGLARNVGRKMDGALLAALRGPDDAIVRDHALAYTAQLRWLARISMEDCADFIEGRGSGLSSAYADYRARLTARALLSGATPGPDLARTVSLTVPPAMLAAARERSGLDLASFRDALKGRGAAAARCNARIALLDTAAISGPEGLDVLRETI
jgi:hypothetical protein